MSLILFFDTESTGLPLYREPSDDPRQPHLVELGALVVDSDTQEIVNGFHSIIRPDGWTIPDEVAEIHGITTERALEVGIREVLAIDVFLELWRGCALRVAHNQSFDARMLRIACKRFQNEHVADEWKAGAAECTALLSSPVLDLPPTEAQQAKTSFKRKTPTLGEAFGHFFPGETFEAHTAIADANACRRIYFALQSLAARAAA